MSKSAYVTIPASEMPRRFRAYQRHVILEGHRPGVLSGAEISGRAAEYAGRYARARESVCEWIAAYGVRSEVVFDSGTRRYCRRWVNSDGDPVMILTLAAEA